MSGIGRGFWIVSDFRELNFCWPYFKDMMVTKIYRLKENEVEIKCTFWFNTGSKIIEDNLWGCFFLFLDPEGGSNPSGPYPNPFPNPAGQN